MMLECRSMALYLKRMTPILQENVLVFEHMLDRMSVNRDYFVALQVFTVIHLEFVEKSRWGRSEKKRNGFNRRKN